MRRRVRGWWLAFFLVLAVGTTVAAAYYRFGRSTPTTEPAAPSPYREVVATPQQIEAYCAKCHAYPPADSFPRSAWKEEVEKAYKIAAQMQLRRPRPDLKGPPSMEQVIRFYQD